MRTVQLASSCLIVAAWLLTTPGVPANEPAPAVNLAAQEPSQAPSGGEVRDDNSLHMKLVYCPPGNFRMGSPISEPWRGADEEQVDVTLTKGFWLGKYEVTQQEYSQIMGANPSEFSAKGSMSHATGGKGTDKFPVENVTWHDACAFCRKLTDDERAAGSLPSDWEYTLPTEAEWEYACRAGTTTATAFGEQLNACLANCNGEIPYAGPFGGPYLMRPTAVGSYRANAWGLYDMHGNVWEWCRDVYHYNLPGGVDPEAKLKHAKIKAYSRIVRGGSWLSVPRICRSAHRFRDPPGDRYYYIGFRVALRQVGR